MRRIRLRGIVLAVVAAVCGIVLTGVANAAPVADTAPAVQSGTVNAQAADCKRKLTYSGYVHIYLNRACSGTPICSTTTDDSDYSNTAGCQGTDNDKASSVLNNGNTHAIRLYQHAGWLGGSYCVANHQYAYDLYGKTFDNGVGANDAISSHDWVTSC